MTAKGPCWNVYSQAVSHFLGKHSNQFLMDMYSWGAVSGKKKLPLGSADLSSGLPSVHFHSATLERFTGLNVLLHFSGVSEQSAWGGRLGWSPGHPVLISAWLPICHLVRGKAHPLQFTQFLHLQNMTTESFCSGFWKGVWGRKDETASPLLLLQLLHLSSKHQI